MRGLPAAKRDEFRELGFLSGLALYRPTECEAFLARMEAFERERAADAAWAFDIKANLLFDWVYETAAESRVLDVVEDLLGPNIFVTNSVFRIKEPGSSTRYGWHQDAARIPVEPCFIIAFLALTEATSENGGLCVIPRSHDRIWPFEVVSDADGQPHRRVARTIGVDEDAALAIALAPGEVAVIDGRLVHGSGPNRTKERRVALLTDYTAAHAKQAIGRGSGQLVRGDDGWGNLGPEPVPRGSGTVENVRARRRILTTYPENPLMGPLAPGEPIAFPDEPGVE